MRSYIIRRLLLLVITVFLVTILCFLSIRLIPGNVIDMMVADMAEGGMGGSELTADYIRHSLGLDAPVYVQYGRWITSGLQGDLGKSLWTSVPVLELIAQRLPVTLEMIVLAMLIAITIALPVGTFSAIRQDTTGDYIGRTIAILAISLPSFWLGTMVMVYPAVWWDWSPPIQYTHLHVNPIVNLQQMILPSIILGAVLSGVTMRMTRTMMLEVLRQDYIRTAWAKGLTERTIIIRHALKNALIPVITVIGTQVAFLVGGSVIMETIFVLPGVGRLLIDALRKRDYPVISGVNLIMATFVLIINLVVDLTYAYLDPRIHYK
ncbi:ABC transporter permease [Chloroflexota bacterium]